MRDHWAIAATLDASARLRGVDDPDLMQWIAFMRLPIQDARFFENVVLICTLPTALHCQVDGRPHNPGGPAVVWADGDEDWFLDGVRVGADLVRRPTANAILQEPNVGARRTRITLMAAISSSSKAPSPGAPSPSPDAPWPEARRPVTPTCSPTAAFSRMPATSTSEPAGPRL
jgi:hypothetical protein